MVPPARHPPPFLFRARARLAGPSRLRSPISVCHSIMGTVLPAGLAPHDSPLLVVDPPLLRRACGVTRMTLAWVHTNKKKNKRKTAGVGAERELVCKKVTRPSEHTEIGPA